MAFHWLEALKKRLLSNQRRSQHFDALADVDDDIESWRGTIATSGTEEWKRIEEGQRMLELSTTLWFGTDSGPFDMKDHERYELLYGRPFGVEDPMLQQLRMQALQTQGGIYVEQRACTGDSHGFSADSGDGTARGTDNGDVTADQAAQQRIIKLASHRPQQKSTHSDPAESEANRLMNMFSFQRRLQPSMSWQGRMTHFRRQSGECAAQADPCSVNGYSRTPPLEWGRLTPTPIPTEATIPEGSPSQLSPRACESSAPTSTTFAATAHVPAETNAAAQQEEAGAEPQAQAAAWRAAAAADDGRTDEEREDERLQHMAWRWRFTKRWCKEHTEPLAEPSRRDVAYTEALAGVPSGAWSHLLRRSTDGGLERESDTLTEGLLFSDFGEDAAAGAPQTSQKGHWRTSGDSRGAAVAARGGWREGRIRGGAVW
eukprot:jgi/Ulvmu1/8578/UM045_0020.1